ncbi:hypothetical protein SDC9_136702 [bioreactor metagenome]|uniref:16S rRNA (uracil(1498)-N(3))-methyltransferase n=1 Tax=bioreactor metagenome TaxID=1076179 RepID=A0A645DJG4_9ZZZZ
MNLILLENSDFITQDTVRVAGRRLKHMAEVLHCAAGMRCKVGVLGGAVGCGEVLAMTPDYAELRIAVDVPPPPEAEVTLIAALPRPKTYRKLLHAAIAMGVKKLVMIQTFKVDKSYWASPFLEPGFFAGEARLALEQAGDTVLPEIAFYRRFKPFVEDIYPELARGRTAYLAHPAGAAPLPDRPGRPALLVVGPEGGFTDYEVCCFMDAGALPVTLGRRTLRTEVALPILLGRWLR